MNIENKIEKVILKALNASVEDSAKKVNISITNHNEVMEIIGFVGDVTTKVSFTSGLKTDFISHCNLLELKKIGINGIDFGLKKNDVKFGDSTEKTYDNCVKLNLNDFKNLYGLQDYTKRNIINHVWVNGDFVYDCDGHYLIKSRCDVNYGKQFGIHKNVYHFIKSLNDSDFDVFVKWNETVIKGKITVIDTRVDVIAKDSDIDLHIAFKSEVNKVDFDMYDNLIVNTVSENKNKLSFSMNSKDFVDGLKGIKNPCDRVYMNVNETDNTLEYYNVYKGHTLAQISTVVKADAKNVREVQKNSDEPHNNILLNTDYTALFKTVLKHEKTANFSMYRLVRVCDGEKGGKAVHYHKLFVETEKAQIIIMGIIESMVIDSTDNNDNE